ncbi:HAMP domain protein, partial [Vibrio cholerae HC-65A1]
RRLKPHEPESKGAVLP